MKPTMFIADVSPRDTPWHKAFPVRPETYGYCYSEYVTLSAANAAIEERDKRIAELERERDFLRTKSVANARERNAAERLVEEAGKVLERFARLDKNYSNSNPCDAVFAKGCVYVSDLRAARSIAAKIGGRNE